MLLAKKDTLINEVKLNERINPSEKVSNKDIKITRKNSLQLLWLILG